MNEFDHQFYRETPEEAAIRLRAKIAAGELYLKPELAKVLMLSAQQSAVNQQFDDALFRVDEALSIAEKLIENNQTEFQSFLVPCFLFRATITLFHRGPEAGLVALNEAIQYFSEKTDRNDLVIQNGLAVALSNKARILTNPLGAYSTAIATQEQAVKIWRHLLRFDRIEHRQQLIAALLECGDMKILCGNPGKAFPHFQEAYEIAHEGITLGLAELYPILIQVLVKQTRLHEQLGDIPNAFRLSRESIQLVRKLVSEGESQAKIMLTTLHLQHGVLLELRNRHTAALEEFDRSRDVYCEILRQSEKPISGNYLLRTGLANVLMYRGNILTELERYDEAMKAFEESAQQYQYAAEFRPENDNDETFIPYSIGVVRLNQANMFVAQGKWEEALRLKEKALQYFHQRLEDGHNEVLPNLVSAYRKMINILKKQGKREEVFVWLNGLTKLLESVVDDGNLEFRNELASSYNLYYNLYEEEDDLAEAEKNAIRSLRILRSIADEEANTPDIHIAKIQWSELLQQIALLRTRQNRLGDAVYLFQKVMDDITEFFNDGNKQAIYDVILTYSQFATFIETIIKSSNSSNTDSDAVLKDGSLSKHILFRLEFFSKQDTEELSEHTPEYFQDWIDQVMNVCSAGIELIQQQQRERNEPTINHFFAIKISYFRKIRSSFFLLRNDPERAYEELVLAAEQWELLIAELEKLKAQNKYLAAEAKEFEKDDFNSNWNINYGWNAIPDWDTDSDWDVQESDFEKTYHNRCLYFVGEFRQILQSWANVCLTLKRFEEAERILNREIDLSRNLVQQEIPDADRFLILSLVNYAQAAENSFSISRTITLFDEARQLIRKRIHNRMAVSDDYSLFIHVYLSYALCLIKNGKAGYVMELMNYYAEDIEMRHEFPSPDIWMELCHAFDIHTLWLTDPVLLKTVRTQQRKLLAQHPEFDSNQQLREWDKQLKEEIEKK
ncbi:MAG: tetratricopeptide repeat protein [Planctomycetaceae bacterium]|jgi:tetratricopeptide (TPR) repeat protein|nr:tetratricopeptide repeat protein [Planctomycetaceae bacterium]